MRSLARQHTLVGPPHTYSSLPSPAISLPSQQLVGRLSEEYLALLPETLPFLAELLEDAELAVEVSPPTALCWGSALDAICICSAASMLGAGKAMCSCGTSIERTLFGLLW